VIDQAGVAETGTLTNHPTAATSTSKEAAANLVKPTAVQSSLPLAVTLFSAAMVAGILMVFL
jgi:hypothetical protein